ncbi:hypothetical protein V5799_017378 [Amblyomma americanum]|uniref:Uncharacterized protein n=1 Tax=Amblyomma americanum TaxID=6943 RepID=A0AAQ4F2G1_AMBAM
MYARRAGSRAAAAGCGRRRTAQLPAPPREMPLARASQSAPTPLPAGRREAEGSPRDAVKVRDHRTAPTASV